MQKIEYDLPIFNDDDEADLNDYSMKMANAIKIQIDKFGNPLIFVGNVQTLADLQLLTNIKNGYIYRVDDENRNYIYNGTEWIIYSDNLELVFYKYTQNITENISAGQIIEIPCRYKVGDYLDVYFMGERLIKNTEAREGHYNEIGEKGSISNEIQVGWNVNAGSYFDFILRANTEVEIEENAKITELQQKNTELEQELKEVNKDLKENSIQGQAEGESIHLEDSSNCRCKIGISGNSEQETSTQSNNVFDPKKAIVCSIENWQNTVIPNVTNNTSITIDENNNLNGTASTYLVVVCPFKFEEGKTIYNCGFIGNRPFLLYNKIGENIHTLLVTNYQNGYTPTENFEGYLGIGIDKNQTVNDNFIMFSYTQNAEFEKFTPNMPSPEYPSSIRNVGDNVQLFDINNRNKVFNAGASDSLIEKGIRVTATASESNLCCVYKVLDVSNYKGKVFTLKANWFSSSLNKGRIMLGLCNENGTIRKFSDHQDILGKPISYIIPENIGETKYLAIWLYAHTSGGTVNIGDYIDYTDIKLEQGTQATPYTTFGYGSVDVKVQNKNLVYKEEINGIGVKIAELEKYTGYITIAIKTNEGTAQVNYRIRYKDGSTLNKSIIATNQSNNVWYVSNENIEKEVAGIELYYTTSGTARSLVNAIVMKGKYTTITDNDYISHEEQTIHFPITKVLHKDDYLADDGIHHKRKTTVLNGTENFNMGTIEGLNHFLSEAKILDYKYIDNNTCNYMSTHFKAIKVSERYKDNTLYITGGKNIDITSNKFSSIAELKAYLAEQYANDTPVTIEYELAEEELEEYTAEQQEAYNKLKELYSYEGVTHITCQNDIKCKFNAEYFKDYNILRQNDKQELQSQIDEIKSSLTSEVSE